MKKLFIALTAVLLCGCVEKPIPVPQEAYTYSETLLGTSESESETETETVSETDVSETTSETETTTEYVPVLPEFEDTPENVYERLNAAFTDEYGDQKAPDDYAGVYSYFGKTYVCITTDEPSEFYTDLLADYTCITYKTVNHSFNELQQIANEAEVLASEKFDVTYSYIDVPSNRAAIEIADGDPKEVREYLENLEGIDFPVDILQITIQ